VQTFPANPLIGNGRGIENTPNPRRRAKAIREHLGLRPGDRVKFFLHPDGSVVLLPKVSVATLRGIVRPRQRPVTTEAMSEAIGAGATQGSSRRRR
jgi:AbrB family looped-hinge helix DNA binding protein